jgi:hypothetical protein
MNAWPAKKIDCLETLQQAWAEGIASGPAGDFNFSEIKCEARRHPKCKTREGLKLGTHS